MKQEFYRGDKIFTMKDINGCEPWLHFIMGNRTAGKTFYFKKWMVKRWLETGERFSVFVRFIDDIPCVAAGYWADVGPICFPKKEMTQKPLLKGKAAELLIGGARCGYVIALNDPERIKRNSALFSDIQRCFFDEFQSETGKYVPGEVEKFNSIMASISRGGAEGTYTRNVHAYLCSNAVSTFNPYFDYYHVGGRLGQQGRFIRGDKWVLERVYNEQAAEAVRSQFSNMSAKEIKYMTDNNMLLDDARFVERIGGQKRPLFNMYHNGKNYTLWRVYSTGMLYVSQVFSAGLPVTLSFKIDDHDINNVMQTTNTPLVKSLRKAYMDGKVRFETEGCKRAFIDCCSIK